MNNQRGFTLAEIVIAMALFSSVLLVLTVGVVQLYQIYSAGLGTRNTQQQARLLGDRLTREIHEAGLVVGDTATNSICIYTPRSAEVGQPNLISEGVVYYFDPIATLPDVRARPLLRRETNAIAVPANSTAATCNPAAPEWGAPQIVTSPEVSVVKLATIASADGGKTTADHKLIDFDLAVFSNQANEDEFELPAGATDGAADPRVRCIDGNRYCTITTVRVAAQALRDWSISP